MEITGKIILALPEMTGVSKSGNNWKKREYVLETMETYPRKVHFDFFGERADQYPLNVGEVVKLSFDIESREYNGRWFTSIRGWKAEKVGAVPAAGADVPPVGPATTFPGGYPPPAAPADLAPAVGDATEDLPF